MILLLRCSVSGKETPQLHSQPPRLHTSTQLGPADTLSEAPFLVQLTPCRPFPRIYLWAAPRIFPETSTRRLDIPSSLLMSLVGSCPFSHITLLCSSVPRASLRRITLRKKTNKKTPLKIWIYVKDLLPTKPCKSPCCQATQDADIGKKNCNRELLLLSFFPCIYHPFLLAPELIVPRGGSALCHRMPHLRTLHFRWEFRRRWAFREP